MKLYVLLLFNYEAICLEHRCMYIIRKNNITYCKVNKYKLLYNLVLTFKLIFHSILTLFVLIL